MAVTDTHRDRVVDTRPRTMNGMDWFALVLLIVGGLNWGLVGLFDFNLVAAIFGVDTVFSNIIYVLVGLSAFWCMYTASKAGSSVRTAYPATATR